jgi:2-oxoglutarate dehydrogenase E2 component (dihydrolipoamide succinyltransferase)
MTDVIMPQMGESIAEGTITKWMKKVGDRVQRDEPLFEISTDKVDAEIPAPASGILKEIRVEPGATVPINTVVGIIGEGDLASASASAPAAVPPGSAAPPPKSPQPTSQSVAAAQPTSQSVAAAPPASQSAAVAQADGTPAAPVPPATTAPSSPASMAAFPPPPPSSPASSFASSLGSAPYSPAAPSPPPPSTSAAPSSPTAAPPAAATPPPPEKPRAEMTPEELRQTRSSPVVRKIAAEHNVDISKVPGTGIAGRVTKQDILGHIETRPASTAAAPSPAPPAAPSAPAPAAPPAMTSTPAAPTGAAPTSPDISATPTWSSKSGAAAARPSGPPPAAPSAPPASTPSPAPAAATPPPAAKPAPSPAPASVAMPTPFVPAHQPGERVEIVPMLPIRKKTAEHMVMSKRISAHVTTVSEVDMSRVAHLRHKYKQQYQERSQVKLTYMPFIVKATVDALKAFPVLNASVDGDNIVYKKDLNIGIAVALDWGLIVPVIRNADEKNVLGMARAINDVAERARAKKLKIDEVQGGTFTITNPGVFGSLFGTPIINQPQVGILAVGTIEKRAVVRDDAIAIRTMCYLALSFDHRIVDGADADRFMAHLKKGLQEFDESAL